MNAGPDAPLAELTGAVARVDGRRVLNGLDLNLAAGALTVLVGPNGAGKTSVIRALVGLLPLETGEARLGGETVGRLSSRARADRVAYLPQEGRVAWNLPAIEVAALGAPFLSGDAALARARAALEDADAGHLADRGVAEMSGGERARVLLARALASDAPLLLADEPAAGLDPDAQLMVLERLRDRSRGTRGVMVSLHDLTLAARFADRVVVVLDGAVTADGPPMQALSPDVLGRVFGLKARWIDGDDGPLLCASRR